MACVVVIISLACTEKALSGVVYSNTDAGASVRAAGALVYLITDTVAAKAAVGAACKEFARRYNRFDSLSYRQLNRDDFEAADRWRDSLNAETAGGHFNVARAFAAFAVDSTITNVDGAYSFRRRAPNHYALVAISSEGVLWKAQFGSGVPEPRPLELTHSDASDKPYWCLAAAFAKRDWPLWF